MKNRNGILQGPENKSVVQVIENTALQIFKNMNCWKSEDMHQRKHLLVSLLSIKLKLFKFSTISKFKKE